MKSVPGAPSFLLLNLLRSSERLVTFEEILASSVDKDEHYLSFKDERLKNTLNPLDLGLVLAGQPIGILADFIAELEEATRHVEMEVEPTKVEGQVSTTTEVEVQTGVVQGEEVEIRGVKKTLSEVFAEAELSFVALGTVKTGS